jgi:hypothetical protein
VGEFEYLTGARRERCPRVISVREAEWQMETPGRDAGDVRLHRNRVELKRVVYVIRGVRAMVAASRLPGFLSSNRNHLCGN